jgi:hypothetical protein
VERRTGFGTDLRRFLLLPPRLLFESLDLCLGRLLCSLDLLQREAGALDHFLPDGLRQALARTVAAITCVTA